jgi:hypothetical protein
LTLLLPVLDTARPLWKALRLSFGKSGALSNATIPKKHLPRAISWTGPGKRIVELPARTNGRSEGTARTRSASSGHAAGVKVRFFHLQTASLWRTIFVDQSKEAEWLRMYPKSSPHPAQ